MVIPLLQTSSRTITRWSSVLHNLPNQRCPLNHRIPGRVNPDPGTLALLLLGRSSPAPMVNGAWIWPGPEWTRPVTRLTVRP